MKVMVEMKMTVAKTHSILLICMRDPARHASLRHTLHAPELMAAVFAYIRPVTMQPCVEHERASLAVCKPGIRRAAKVGDIVVAYGYPRGVTKGRLALVPSIAFAGRVSRKLRMEEYMGNERRDSRIYRSDGTRSVAATPYDRQN